MKRLSILLFVFGLGIMLYALRKQSIPAHSMKTQTSSHLPSSPVSSVSAVHPSKSQAHLQASPSSPSVVEDYASVAESRAWPSELVALVRAYQVNTNAIEAAKSHSKKYWLYGFQAMDQSQQMLGGIFAKSLLGVSPSFMSDARSARDIYSNVPSEVAENMIKALSSGSSHAGSQTDWELVEKLAHPVAGQLRDLSMIGDVSQSEFDEMYNLARSGKSVSEAVSMVKGPVYSKALDLQPLLGQKALQAAYAGVSEDDLKPVREKVSDIEKRIAAVPPSDPESLIVKHRLNAERESFVSGWLSQLSTK